MSPVNDGTLLKTGVCRVCGCTEEKPCQVSIDVVGEDERTIVQTYAGTCWWVDEAHTLCNSVRCIGEVPLEVLERELHLVA